MAKLSWENPQIINLAIEDTHDDTFSQFDGMEGCPTCAGSWVWDMPVVGEDITQDLGGHYEHTGICLEPEIPSTTSPTIEGIVPLS